MQPTVADQQVLKGVAATIRANLFDQDGYDNATGGRRLIPAGVLQTYSLTPPRTWGVQVQYHF